MGYRPSPLRLARLLGGFVEARIAQDRPHFSRVGGVGCVYRGARQSATLIWVGTQKNLDIPFFSCVVGHGGCQTQGNIQFLGIYLGTGAMKFQWPKWRSTAFDDCRVLYQNSVEMAEICRDIRRRLSPAGSAASHLWRGRCGCSKSLRHPCHAFAQGQRAI